MRTIGGLLLCFLLLSACSPFQGRQPDPPAPAFTTIRVGFTESYQSGPMLDLLIGAFQQQYPQYRLEKIYLDRSVNGEEEQIRRGDVDVAPSSWSHLRSQLFTDLTPYIQKSGLDMSRFNFPPGQLEWAGSIPQLPFAVMPTVLLANEALFEGAGVPLPQQGWTWDEFREAARRLTRGDGHQKVWGLAGTSAEHLVPIWLDQRLGGSWWLATEAELKPALHLFSSMVHLDQSSPRPKASDYGSVWWMPDQHFWHGQAAMALEGLESFANPRPREIRWVYLPMPASPGERPRLHVHLLSLGLARSSDRADAAWEFIRFATGPEGAQVLANAGALPAYLTPEIAETWVQRQAPGAQSVVSATWSSHEWLMGSGSPEFARLLALSYLSNQALSGELEWDAAAGAVESTIAAPPWPTRP